MKAFQILYENNPTPVNVVLCIGINDVLQGKSPDYIIQKLHEFQTLILNHSSKYKHAHLGLEINTVGICPIIRPPKCTALNRNFEAPSLDKKAEIDYINSEIKNMNGKLGCSPPAHLNVLGIRTDRRGKMSHRLNDWREDNVGKKLHLSSDLKCAAAIKIAAWFEKCPKT